MKYCSKCGNELLDEAVICPKCGCMVEGIKSTTPKNTSNFIAENIIAIMGAAALIAAIILFAAPFISVSIGGFSRGYSGFDLLFSWRQITGKDASWFLMPSLITILMPIAIITNYFEQKRGILNLVNGKKRRKKKYIHIIVSAISIIPFFYYMLFLLLDAGFSDNPLASVGYGAFMSSLCFFAGMSMLSFWFEQFIKKQKKNNTDDVEKPTPEELIDEQADFNKGNNIDERTKKIIKITAFVICAIIILVFITLAIILIINQIKVDQMMDKYR